jgi:hypothetical protein
VGDIVDAIVAEAYRRMRDAGLSHMEAAGFLRRWEHVETEADFVKEVDDICREADQVAEEVAEHFSKRDEH